MHIFLFVFVFREVKESTQLLYCNMAERKFSLPEGEQNQRDPSIELNPLCNHPDLKKDATSVDDLAKFLKTHDTSSKFLPHVTAIKNRIKLEQEEVHVLSANKNQCAADEESDIEINEFDIFRNQ